MFKTEQELRGYSPPAPPVLFKVPFDVFYPFLGEESDLSGAAPAGSVSGKFIVRKLLRLDYRSSDVSSVIGEFGMLWLFGGVIALCAVVVHQSEWL